VSYNIVSSSETVSSTISDFEVVSGGYLTINPGGESINSTIFSGGTEVVSSVYISQTSSSFQEEIGSALNTTVNSGGTLEVGGITSGTVVNNGGKEIVGGKETGATVNSGGSIYFEGGGNGDNITVSSGANLYLESPGDLNNLYADEGSYLNFGIFGVEDFNLYVKDGVIYEKYYQYPSGVPTNNPSLELEDTPLFNIKTDEDLNGYNLTEISSSDDEYKFLLEPSSPACFLEKTLILIDGKYIPIEYIYNSEEKIKITNINGEKLDIIWVGKSRCNVRNHLPDDEAGYPVRILKEAISDGVPFKDMLITAEHCLFFDGQFVPARMLVNGRSIFFDKSITSYDYYHIETEDHSVIMADGMLTESYLDTGNRSTFFQKGNVVSIGSSRNLSWDDAAVPLTVSRETIEPLFRKIENRADKAGFAIHTEARPLTNESNLHLTTDTGAVIRPTRQNNGRVMFMIPSGVESVRIVSNASRPCDVIGPFIDDRRSLGVLVGTVTLFESNRTRTLTDHLHDAQLSGWNNVEEGTIRWTRGNALLSLGERAPGALALMAIEVRAAGPYVLDEAISEHQALKA